MDKSYGIGILFYYWEKKTWDIVNPPPGSNILGCRWVYKRKIDNNKTILKARIVAKGFSQKHGIYYELTYSPVVIYSTIRLLFAYTAKLQLDVYHYDVDNAFLNDELLETIYMCQPEGFENKGQEDKVCKLKKSIYKVKQSGRAWNNTLDTFIRINLGFHQASKKKCLLL